MALLKISIRTPPQLVAAIALCLTAVLFVACATQTIATVETERGILSIHKHLVGGKYSVNVGPHVSLALEGYTSAHIENVWNLAPGRVVLISGTNGECAKHRSLFVESGAAASIHSIGQCGDNLSFTRDGEVLTIKQGGAREERLWSVRDGILDGPSVQIIRASKARRVLPTRAAESGGATTSLPTVSAPAGPDVIPMPLGSADPGGTQKKVPNF